MKVRELIAKLQELDQEGNINITDEQGTPFPPLILGGGDYLLCPDDSPCDCKEL